MPFDFVMWTGMKHTDESLNSNILEKAAFSWHLMREMDFLIDVKVDANTSRKMRSFWFASEWELDLQEL